MSASAYTVSLATPHGQRVQRELLGTLEPVGLAGRLWIGGLLAVCALGLYAYVHQLIYGLEVTAMRNYVSWGLYMANFVFFIGISHAGTLISAILRVTNAEWRRPITRMAEAITVFALMVGASMVVIDMGRPDRVLNVFVHGRLQSPILWDLCSIMTYLTGSLLYLYIAMIPDMPLLARRARQAGGRRLARFYELLAIGYRGTPGQERRLNVALGAMAVIIIPVAISVHTVVSWVFGMTVRPGWHSTIFGPYFVVGAIFSGTAAIITAMAVFRRVYGLQRYLTLDHFRKLALLLLALTLLYAYFTLSEYLTLWYGGLATKSKMLALLMSETGYGVAFWGWVALGLFVPIALLLFPGRRSLASIVAASVLINIGMWVKRYLIVVPTLETPYIPAQAAGTTIHYFPTWVEWAVTAGALAAFLLLFTVFSRLFPIVSIWEAAEDEGLAEQAGEAVAEPEARGRRRKHLGPPIPATGRLLVWAVAAGTIALALALTAGRAHAQTGSGAWSAAPAPALDAAPPTLQVEVAKEEEAGETVLIATVTAAGRPVEGARVGFFTARLFGEMALGEDFTLDDGTAAVPFPHDLPGDAAGRLHVIARVLAPEEMKGARGEAVLDGAAVAAAAAGGLPRALWSDRAPIGVMIVIASLLLIVWLTYGFVVVQLVRIRAEGEV
jgi:Ni/Fe-hydrogenase subunit HybB-like protein